MSAMGLITAALLDRWSLPCSHRTQVVSGRGMAVAFDIATEVYGVAVWVGQKLVGTFPLTGAPMAGAVAFTVPPDILAADAGT